MVRTAQSAPLPSLSRPKTLVERREIDEAARVAALADAALAVEGFDLEPDHPALHCDHPRRGPHDSADRRCGQVADIDLGADRDPAGFEKIVDGVGGRHFHFHDHHRRPEHRRHRRDDMPDGAIGRHLEGALGAHADLDDVACIHGLMLHHNVVPANAGDPYRVMSLYGRKATAFLNNQRQGLWVPACAGATSSEDSRYLLCAALRSTKVLPPFILWASGASLIWMVTASASTPRFFTNACVMSRIMPAFCSSVRPAAMLPAISGIFVTPVLCFRDGRAIARSASSRQASRTSTIFSIKQDADGRHKAGG